MHMWACICVLTWPVAYQVASYIAIYIISYGVAISIYMLLIAIAS